MDNDLQNILSQNIRKRIGFISLFLFLCSLFSANAQVTAAIDSTSIKIGAQITYHITVETDSTKLVVFPEGQTFQPLEVIESYNIDTLKNKAKINLIKKYALTQFDSGHYTIPRQKIIIGDKTLFTDSLQVKVRNIAVDTTKQGLYDIKPIIEVEKPASNWWQYLLITLFIIGAIAFLLYWFIWRKKPLTEAEQIALLPPYDRAKLALKKLDESPYLENREIKEYYSELTFIIRKYLDEKVYDRALESTTDELITRLKLLKEGNQVDLKDNDIKNLESILKRADLVKFAKSAVDIELAKLDRNTIDIEVDNVKEALPEPTEEEKLLNEQYRKEQEQKKKRNKIILTTAIALFLLAATFVGFGLKYGFGYVKDTIIGHDTKELLEGEWVTSAYGVPPITVTTPKVLKRQQILLNPKDSTSVQKPSKNDAFYYGSMLSRFYILVRSVPANPGDILKSAVTNQEQAEALSKLSEAETKAYVLNYLSEEFIKTLEQAGAQNIIVEKEDYNSNDAKGLRVYGNFKAENTITKSEMEYHYQIYLFAEMNAIQTVIFTFQNDDDYAQPIMDRVINSIKLNSQTEKEN
ncbi:MAG: BatD family protein [Aestuariibaculum sp.]